MFGLDNRTLAGALTVLGLSGAPLGEAAAAGLVLTSQLQQALEQAGWDAQVSEDGSLILRRAAASSRPDTAAPEQAEADMWNELRATGWRVETDADGSRLLYPPAAARPRMRARSVARRSTPGCSTSPPSRARTLPPKRLPHCAEDRCQ